MNHQNLDIVSVFVFVAALIFSPAIAAVVGPYLVIVLSSTVGASFALARRDKSTRMQALWFFLRINGLAILLTVGGAMVIRIYWPTLEERWLLAPIAFVVGVVGDQWPALLRWAGSKVNALVDVLIKLKGGSQ